MNFKTTPDALHRNPLLKEEGWTRPKVADGVVRHGSSSIPDHPVCSSLRSSQTPLLFQEGMCAHATATSRL